MGRKHTNGYTWFMALGLPRIVSVYQCIGAFFGWQMDTHPLVQQTHSRSGQNLQVLLILDAARASAHGPWCQNMFEMTSQWPICCRWGFHDVQRFTSDFQPFQFSWVRWDEVDGWTGASGSQMRNPLWWVNRKTICKWGVPARHISCPEGSWIKKRLLFVVSTFLGE